jgi:hypothetical protein
MDHCDGLPSGIPENLLLPFIQSGQDRTGLELGLNIGRLVSKLTMAFSGFAMYQAPDASLPLTCHSSVGGACKRVHIR